MMTFCANSAAHLRFSSPTGSRASSAIRRGVTITEVLVSLAVMSIGVIAVATLFPLSVLRTVQATQLTNAAQLRYNFEGMAGARPEVYAGAEAWQAGKQYAVGDLIVGTIPSEAYFECTTGGVSFTLEPNWTGFGNTTTEDPGGAAAPKWVTHRARLFMVDPLGWQNRTEDLTAAPAVNSANIRNSFGRTTLAGSTVANDSRYRIVRFRGGVPNAPAPVNLNPSSSTFWPAVGSQADIAANFGARQMAVLPDSWVLQTDTADITTPAAPVTTLQLSNLPTSLIQTLDRNADSVVDLIVSPGTAAERDISARVTLYDVTGKISHVRQLTRIDSPSAGVEQLTWTGQLPSGFTPARARIETFEPRYSWMLSGRHNGPTAYLNLVVFFRRSSDPEDELIHPAHFRIGSWPGIDNTLGTTDDISEPTVVIQFHADLAGQRPFLKRGGYVCDAQNNRWYRVISFREVADARAAQLALDPNFMGTMANTPGAVVKLDNGVLEESGFYPNDGGSEEPGGAILMPGIIDVYPLQPRLPWEN